MSSSTPPVDYLEKIEFKKGDFLFREGDKTYCFYIIQEGSIEVFLTDSNDKEISLAHFGPGQPVGEFALVVNKPRCANARALADGTATRITEQGYKMLLTELPEWALRLMESLIERLRQTDVLLKTLSDAQDADITKDTFELIRTTAAR